MFIVEIIYVEKKRKNFLLCVCVRLKTNKLLYISVLATTRESSSPSGGECGIHRKKNFRKCIYDLINLLIFKTGIYCHY